MPLLRGDRDGEFDNGNEKGDIVPFPPLPPLPLPFDFGDLEGENEAVGVTPAPLLHLPLPFDDVGSCEEPLPPFPLPFDSDGDLEGENEAVGLTAAPLLPLPLPFDDVGSCEEPLPPFPLPFDSELGANVVTGDETGAIGAGVMGAPGSATGVDGVTGASVAVARTVTVTRIPSTQCLPMSQTNSRLPTSSSVKVYVAPESFPTRILPSVEQSPVGCMYTL